MPSNNDKYKTEELVLEVIALRDLHLKLKDLIHDNRVRHQTKVPTRKELISSSTVYTKVKDHVIRLSKARDKKDAKTSGKGSTSKLRVVRVDGTLASFLRLKERGLPADMYPDTLVTSYFTDWVVRCGLQNGKEVLLTRDGNPINQHAADFIRLFSADLKRLGSGPTVKVGQVDPHTGLVSDREVLTSVFDDTGRQINPFNMNKHMFIFAPHYPQVAKNIGGKLNKGREVINRDEHPDVYDLMHKEHTLFTVDIGNARKRYRETQDTLKRLQDKKDKAIQVGDRTITDSITRASTDLFVAKQHYTNILNSNRITHGIAL